MFQATPGHRFPLNHDFDLAENLGCFHDGTAWPYRYGHCAGMQSQLKQCSTPPRGHGPSYLQHCRSLSSSCVFYLPMVDHHTRFHAHYTRFTAPLKTCLQNRKARQVVTALFLCWASQTIHRCCFAGSSTPLMVVSTPSTYHGSSPLPGMPSSSRKHDAVVVEDLSRKTEPIHAFSMGRYNRPRDFPELH